VEKPYRVAYQGVPGAYSEMAACNACPDAEPVPCEQFEVAFQVRQEGCRHTWRLLLLLLLVLLLLLLRLSVAVVAAVAVVYEAGGGGARCHWKGGIGSSERTCGVATAASVARGSTSSRVCVSCRCATDCVAAA